MMFPTLTTWKELLHSSAQIGPTANNNTTDDALDEQVPEVAKDLNLVDSLIAKQMMELSVEDREKTYMDIHGVKQHQAESEQDIDAGLELLESELQKLQDKQAYDLAKSIDATYVENRDFRLAFLRADSYDPSKAAERIMRHFQVKMDLFGMEKLAMDIVQDDLDKEAMEAVYCGRGQYTNARDRAGRTIIAVAAGSKYDVRAMSQAFFYYNMVGSRDPDVQLYGAVGVILALDGIRWRDGSRRTQWAVANLAKSMPTRIEAIHMCHDSLFAHTFMAVVKMAFSPFVKIRTRVHFGNYNEVLASLAGYGVSPSDIPISVEGKITNLESYHERLRKQRAQERLTQPRRNRISVPSNIDVLFGKGTPSQTHVGNESFRALVAQWHKTYEKAGKAGKIQMAKEVLNAVHQSSGLFLRKDGDSWVCVDDDAARQKISAAFRTYRRLGGWKA